MPELPMEVIPTDDGGYDIEAMIREQLDIHDFGAHIWHVDEIQDLRPDLTREQSLQVIKGMEASWDAVRTIHIKIAADHYFPEAECGQQEPDPLQEQRPESQLWKDVLAPWSYMTPSEQAMWAAPDEETPEAEPSPVDIDLGY
jgi:hypothetical protein